MQMIHPGKLMHTLKHYDQTFAPRHILPCLFYVVFIMFHIPVSFSVSHYIIRFSSHNSKWLYYILISSFSIPFWLNTVVSCFSFIKIKPTCAWDPLM